MRKRTRWLLVAAVVVAVGLGYLAYSRLTQSRPDNLTVSELKTQVESLNDQHIIVEGKVAPGSIDWDDKTKVMRFNLTDDRERLTVVYNGIVPDYFKPGADLIVVGKYRPDNTFEASSIGRRGSLCNACHQ